MLTITHTHEEGTLIDGTARGDGTAEILKANGWRWGRSIGAWYLPHSRDHRPKRYAIDQTAKALTAAGFDVALDLDDTVRPTAEVEADKIARQQDRAEALAAKADRKTDAALAADAAADRAHRALPEGGEPIKIGHHSEGRHRRAIERAHTAMRRTIEATAEAERAAARAEAAAHTTAMRYSPRQVANRLEKIAADIRRVQRHLDGYIADRGTPYARQIPRAEGTARDRYLSELAEHQDAHAYWEGIRAQQIADGVATNFTRDQFTKGDIVKVDGRWAVVLRINPKSLSVQSQRWRYTARYDQIQEHHPGGADAAEKVAELLAARR